LDQRLLSCCCTAGIGASVLLADLVYDVPANVILDSARRALSGYDVITSCIKAWVFGLIISTVGDAAHAGVAELLKKMRRKQMQSSTFIMYGAHCLAAYNLPEHVYMLRFDIRQQACLLRGKSCMPAARCLLCLYVHVFVCVLQISCAWGFTTTGGAKGVGESTTSAVVISLVMIFVADFVLSFLFFQGQGDALKQLK
jgi:hypothetical protein